MKSNFLPFFSVTVLSLVASTQADAEYRAFLLQIQSAPTPAQAPTTSPATEPALTVKSSLDPEQYRYYYHVPPGAKISYTETWMCPSRNLAQSQYKRTVGFDPVCKSPKELAAENPTLTPTETPTQSPERQPASK